MAIEGSGGPVSGLNGGPVSGLNGGPEGGTAEHFPNVVEGNIFLNTADDFERSEGDEVFAELGHDNGDNAGVIPSEGEGEDYGEEEDDIDSEGHTDGEDEECSDGDEGLPTFIVGETFANKKEIVAAINNYAIHVSVKLRIVKSDPSRILVRCQQGCPFVLYVSKDGQHAGFKLKTLLLEHSCSRVFKNTRASVKWLAGWFKKKVQERPNYKVADMKKDAEQELMVSVSIYKCKRAKRLIVQGLEGSYIDEFNHLEAYCHELRKSNPGSDVSVDLSKESLENGKRVFSRLYLCFNAAKTSWKAGCRPIIGVDGTFLKGNARGIMLTATGLDANDSLYPIAIGITQKENKLNWKWFFQWLKKSLDLGDGDKVTIMSDMQKGLLAAVSEVLPLSEQRLCARHIYANWSKSWGGGELKKKFFSCAWSTFEEQFHDNLKQLAALSEGAAKAAVSYPVKSWVRAYLSCRPQSWIVDNNLSESFNAWVDDFRYLPIIRMIEGMRVKLMTKWAEAEKNVSRWKGNFSPKCIALFEDNKQLSMRCQVYFNGDDGYEVTEGDDKHTVFITEKRCSCRVWDLTGVPCQHAICALYHAHVDPVTQISRFYHRDTYIASYRTKFQPVRGRTFWEKHPYEPMEPPPVIKMPGRPTKRRIRTEEGERRRRMVSEPEETQQGVETTSNVPTPRPEKATKKGSASKCTLCHQPGHNRATCKDRPSTSASAKRKRTTNTDSESTPDAQPSQLSSAQSSVTPRPRGGRAFYKSRVVSGMGVQIDEDTGRTVYNPGMQSSRVIYDGTSSDAMQHDEDVQTTFPIPNHHTMRMTRSMCRSTTEHGYRSVKIIGDGSTQPTPSKLPVTPPGLMWRGASAMPTSRLLAHRDQAIRASTRKKFPASRGKGRGR